MAKKAKAKSSDKMLTLFQDKTFTLLFFIGIFVLFGGMFYLLQTSAARIKSTVTISVNGCQITASGVPGATFEYGAYAPNKGVSETVVIPSSGTYTATSGGSVGMTSYGKIINDKGRAVASAERTISETCL